MKDKKNKTVDAKTYKFDTLSLHAGYQPHKNAGSRQVPIYQTTSYLFDDVLQHYLILKEVVTYIVGFQIQQSLFLKKELHR